MTLLHEQSQRAARRTEITRIASYKSVQQARIGVVWPALKLLSLLFVIVLLFIVSACGQVPAAIEKLPQISQEIQQGAAAAQPGGAIEPARPAPATIAPFALPLEATLPRSITYASLEWTVSAATIDNRAISLFGDSEERTGKYRTARITLRIKNPLSGYTNLGSNIAKLQLGDGKRYDADETGRVELPGGNAETESRLIFRVPADAVWNGAKLVISEPQKIPAELPLEGDLEDPAYPTPLDVRGGATAGKVSYRIVEALLDLDLHDKRAREGERFLKLKVRVENNGGGGGLPLSEDYFRLVVDGAPLAPAHAPIKLIKPNSAYDAMVVFAVPADLTAAELSVGEGGVAEAISLDLNSARP